MEVRDDLAPATPPPRIPVYGTTALENLVLAAATGEPDADAMMTDHDPIENRDAIYPGLPRNIKEALEGPDGDKWYNAYHKMVLAFEANRTWRPMRTKDVPLGTPSFSLGTTLSKKRGTGLRKSASTSTASALTTSAHGATAKPRQRRQQNTIDPRRRWHLTKASAAK